MGKNIALFALLLLLLGGAVWQGAYIENVTNELIGSLEQVRSAVEQDDAPLAEQRAADFNALWQKEKSTYEALFEHKEVDTISAKALSLIGMCTPDTMPEALSIVDETLFYLEHIHSIDTISWENIL